MVYNTLKKKIGRNLAHLLTITMATMMHPFKKKLNGQQQYEGLFSIKKNQKKSGTIKKVKC